jgi:hypothetical protein
MPKLNQTTLLVLVADCQQWMREHEHVFLNQTLAVEILIKIDGRVLTLHAVVRADRIHLVVLLLGDVEMVGCVVKGFAGNGRVLDGGVCYWTS